jgi:hypothetical protein
MATSWCSSRENNEALSKRKSSERSNLQPAGDCFAVSSLWQASGPQDISFGGYNRGKDNKGERMNQSNQPQYNPVPLLPTSTMATISLIAGILGFMGLPIIASIAALITGYAARKETRAVPPTASGDGLATAGIVMGWIQVGLGAVTLCCVIAYFALALGGLAFWNSN